MMKIVGDNFEFTINTGEVGINLDSKLSVGLRVSPEALEKAKKVVNKADSVVQLLKEMVESMEKKED